jgi:hypothetical protein
MSLNVAPLPEQAGAPVPSLRAAAPVVSVTGVTDDAAMARQQLPSAVPAPAQLAASAAYVPSAYKPLVRMPSSALAAQWLAQDASAGESEAGVALFAPPKPAAPTAPPMADHLLADMRMARGELPPDEARVAATRDAAATLTSEARASVFNEQRRSAGLSSLAASLPTLFNAFVRKPSLVQARGVAAYQLAAARNVTIKTPVSETSAS